MQNHYEILGLDRSASTDEVKSAYRLRSHMFHPDKYENYPEPLRTQLKSEAAKEFKKLTAAYEVLRDTRKRREHDRDLDTSGRGATRSRRAAAPRSTTHRTTGAAPRAAGTTAGATRTRAPEPPPSRPRERDPLLVVRPDRLDFGALAAGTARQLPLKISNAGGRTLFGEITSNRAWLSVNRRSFVGSSILVFVSVDTAGLRPGEEYGGSLLVGTLNGGDQVVPVLMRVSGQPEPLLSGAPSFLDFGVTDPGSRKVRTVKLANAGTGTLIGSVAVKSEWLAVSENRFRGNEVSFEVIANTTGLEPGEQQGEIVVFSNGGQAAIQILIEIPIPAPGGAIVGGASGAEPGDESDRFQAQTEATRGERPYSSASSNGAAAAPSLPNEAQRALLRRISLIEPESVWERDFLSRIAQLVRAGERLAPGELAKIYELEAKMQAGQEQADRPHS